MVNFMGKYVYFGLGKDGVEAVKVTEDDEPQAVIGSYLHRYAYPDNIKRKQELQNIISSRKPRSGLQLRMNTFTCQW
jgi:hypothetical protein